MKLPKNWRPPEGTKLRYATRRHWFELVEEVADFVWWLAISLSVSVGLGLLYRPLYAMAIPPLLILAIPLAMEIARWNAEWWIIVDYPRGKSTLRRLKGILCEHNKGDDINAIATEEKRWIHEKYLGFTRVKASSNKHVYFEGERVPLRLMEEIKKAPITFKQLEPETEDQFLVQNLRDWTSRDVIPAEMEKEIVKQMLNKWLWNPQ
jgi:hypothetical protein